MKRYYTRAEFDNKIRLLGDYYRYHFEAPRMFLPAVERIIEVNTEDNQFVWIALIGILLTVSGLFWLS